VRDKVFVVNLIELIVAESVFKFDVADFDFAVITEVDYSHFIVTKANSVG